MNITYEPLPTSGYEPADREIKAVNRLIEIQVSALSGIGIENNQIDSAREGRYGSAVQEMFESLLPSMKVFEDELDVIRGIIEDIALAARQNSEIAERGHKVEENFHDLISRLRRIQEMLEG